MKRKCKIFWGVVGVIIIGSWGGCMLAKGGWEKTHVFNISDIYSKDEEQEPYRTDDIMMTGDQTLLFGTKDLGQIPGGHPLERPSNMFIAFSKNNKLVEVKGYDRRQNEPDMRTNVVQGSIFLSAHSFPLRSYETPSLISRLYKITLQDEKVSEIAIPEKISHIEITPMFLTKNIGYLFPGEGATFYKTEDGGQSWQDYYLPLGYARQKDLDRELSGAVIFQPKTHDVYMTGHFTASTREGISSPLYTLSADNRSRQGWKEVARLEGYDINDIAFLPNGHLLILAFKGDRIHEQSDHREAEIFIWDGKTFEHQASLGPRTLFSPTSNTNLQRHYFSISRNGTIILNGSSFRNKEGDLPVYNVSYISRDYGKTWEKESLGMQIGPSWYDPATDYRYNAGVFSVSRKRP